ncbi:hypothetical protein MMC11_001627 [Xylographa trunciseda]|nr:hypothetical protein [Xylographa trunciseda]
MEDSEMAFFLSIPWCAKFLVDPSFVIVPTSTRLFKQSTEDALFAETLKTEDTIRALGYRLNGYPHLCHGGIVATIMDEVMSTLLSVNKSRSGIYGGPVTASLNVSFLQPVWTPQVVLVTAKLGAIRGRKVDVESSVRDSNGNDLAKGEALFIRMDDPREKL